MQTYTKSVKTAFLPLRFYQQEMHNFLLFTDVFLRFVDNATSSSDVFLRFLMYSYALS